MSTHALASSLHELLTHADAANARLLGEAVARWGGPALGAFTLPSLGPGPGSAADLEVVATVFALHAAERAGLFAVVEALASGFATGAFTPGGSASSLLALLRFWRSSAQRFIPAERVAQFQRVLDGLDDGNGGGALPALVAALAAYGREPVASQRAPHHARAMALANELRATLGPRASGITPFFARELTARLREAMQILAHPAVQAAAGGARSPGEVLARLAPRVLGRAVSPAAEVARGNAGAAVLRWVASSATLSPGHPAVRAAEAWLASAPVGTS